MRSIARVALALCLIGGVIIFVVTFALTEQTPDETTTLSRSVERHIVMGGSADGSYSSGTQNSGVAGALLSVADIRAWAHVPEFFLQGFFLFGAAALWPHAVRGGGRAASARVRYGIALLACAACSLFDQVHKAFVPGREFDARDLLFDAIGYLLAMAVVLAISVAMHAVGRSRSRTGGRD